MQINIHEAKTHFSNLIERAMESEEIVIARNGHPLLKFTPCVPLPKKRLKGLSAAGGSISSDFDAPLTDNVLREFE